MFCTEIAQHKSPIRTRQAIDLAQVREYNRWEYIHERYFTETFGHFAWTIRLAKTIGYEQTRVGHYPVRLYGLYSEWIRSTTDRHPVRQNSQCKLTIYMASFHHARNYPISFLGI